MKEIEKNFNKILFLDMIFYVGYAILGVIIFLESEMTNNIVGVLIGSFLLINGLIFVYKYLDKTKIKLFKSSLIFGIINIFLGIFIMLNPLTLVNILNIGLGVWILIEGVNKSIIFIELKKVQEDANKLILVSSFLLILIGILMVINPFRSLVITKLVGVFIILDSIINLNDLVLLKKRSNYFIKHFK